VSVRRGCAAIDAGGHWLAGLGTRLPFERTTFIGRERELEMVRDLLRRPRLVTLIAVGGAGKTRLALEVASELEETFEAGARLVELAPHPQQACATCGAAHDRDRHETCT
jgi:non-specific serine/threonine protein kinase